MELANGARDRIKWPCMYPGLPSCTAFFCRCLKKVGLISFSTAVKKSCEGGPEYEAINKSLLYCTGSHVLVTLAARLTLWGEGPSKSSVQS